MKERSVKLIQRNEVIVNLAFDGTITLSKNGIKLVFKEIQKPTKCIEKTVKEKDWSYKPKANHPWKKLFKPEKPDISNEQKRGHF